MGQPSANRPDGRKYRCKYCRKIGSCISGFRLGSWWMKLQIEKMVTSALVFQVCVIELAKFSIFPKLLHKSINIILRKTN